MNKRIIFAVCFFVIVAAIYAEAPELRNVMPNSWRKVTKLTANEEQAFVREHSALFAEMKEKNLTFNLGWQDGRKYEHYSVYKQQVGAETFYRVLCTDNSSPQFLSPSISFIQEVIYENILLIRSTYNVVIYALDSRLGVFAGIDIISGKEKVKGVLYTRVIVKRDDNNIDNWNSNVPLIKGQLAGGTDSTYYLMEEALKKAAGEKYLSIRIDASPCLVDPNIPLRYSLQNAFDNDPSTSYVENTEDDLMGISGLVGSRKIAIINGYAQSMSLYKNNNRASKVSLLFWGTNTLREFELTDNTLSWQFIETDGGGGFSVTDIYKGNRYNDTCIAEYNVYTEAHGWLFGDIDE